MDEKLKKLGRALKELRIQNNLSFRDADRLSGVDISSISRLEEGKTRRINPLTLNKLARTYKTNPLTLLKIIDYVSDEDIIEYNQLFNHEISSANNNEIEVLNQYQHSYFPKKFIKVPSLDNYKAIEVHNHIFLYNDNCLYNDDLGLFSIDNEFFVAFYYTLENVISIKDYFTNSVSMFTNIEIIGKIQGILSYKK